MDWINRCISILALAEADATLDLANPLRDHRPIIDKLKERIPVSIALSGCLSFWRI
jgi:hypothetical protein